MQSLDKYRPFKITGDDFTSSNPIFAFFFYRYFLDAALGMHGGIEDPGQRHEVEMQIQEVNQKMSAIQNTSQIKMNEKQNLIDMLEYTELMFAKNQHSFANDFKNRQIAEDYLTIHRLYEVIKSYHGLNDQQDKRRVFAKKRFVDLMREIKKKPEQSQEVVPPPPPKPIEEKIKASVYKAPLPKPTEIVSYDKIQMQLEANKRLENAISELSFDRYKFAKEEALHALQLLEQLAE